MLPDISISMRFIGLSALIISVACTQPSSLHERVEQGSTPEEIPTTETNETEEEPAEVEAAEEPANQPDDINEDASTEETPHEDSAPSDGSCELGPGIAGQDVVLEFPWDGETRTWILHLPTDYDCTPRPLLLGAHAYLSDGYSFQHDVAQIFDHINEHGYIGIFPDAMARSEQ